jgi:SAM-dependent methyltransferase
VSTAKCPGCGSGAVRLKGAIPDNQMFAGRAVAPMPAELAVCRSCHLGFRSPQPARAELAALYGAGSESAWSADEQVRRDWQLAAEWVNRVGASSVLDVGCFDGGFLELLPGTISKAGVEINAAAAQRASERGIEIVAADLHDLATVTEKFDFVSAFDVIEHVHDPSAFLAALSEVVAPGGHVVFSTGNLDAPTWRAMGSRYLYSWFLEHIAFVSPHWVRRQAPRLGFDVVSIDRFSHTSDVRLGFLAGMLKNGAYKMSPRLLDAVRAKTRASQSEGEPVVPAAPPAWTSARDHILVVLRNGG